MWMSGGSRSVCSSVPTRTNRIAPPNAEQVLHTTVRQAGQRRMFYPVQLAVNIITASGSPDTISARLGSIMAFNANDAPDARWRLVHWQQCTTSGLLVMR